MDNVRGFSKNNWNRVVAVFAIGPTWQFKTGIGRRQPKYLQSAPGSILNMIMFL